jgi:hypothetical protein
MFFFKHWVMACPPFWTVGQNFSISAMQGGGGGAFLERSLAPVGLAGGGATPFTLSFGSAREKKENRLATKTNR